MKRVLAGALVLFAACSDTPTQLAKVQPQLTTIGDNATWYFEGHVVYDFDSPQADVGDFVKGTVTFRIASDDIIPDPCVADHFADVTFRYTVNGVSYLVGGVGTGYALAGKDCDNLDYPWLQLNTYRTGGESGWLNLYYPADTEDFPLMPPALADWVHQGFRMFSVHNVQTQVAFYAELDVLRLPDPQLKVDCMNGGWQQYGFKNQGQCVRFIETGKRSQ